MDTMKAEAVDRLSLRHANVVNALAVVIPMPATKRMRK